MFQGISGHSSFGKDGQSGLASRFISDAETAGVMVTLLDSGAMQVVEFGSAIVVLGLLAPWTILVVAPVLVLTWVVTRRMQEPVALAGQRRQEELEHMTQAIAREVVRRGDPQSASRFGSAVDRVLAAEVRYGWLHALNLQGSGGLAKLGPIAAIVVAAFTGTHQAGTLVAVYLIAQRAFWGFDGLVDLSLDLQSVRGAVARCFELVDAGTPTPEQTESLL